MILSPVIPTSAAPVWKGTAVCALVSSAGGAMVGVACGVPAAWPFALAGLALMGATAITSSMRHGWSSTWVVVAGVATWQATATGWAVMAVREDDPLRLVWQAAVLLAIVGHHVVLSVMCWWLVRWALSRLSPQRDMSSTCHAAVFALAWMAAESVRQWGWPGNGYGAPALALLDAPGVGHLMPVLGAQGVSFLSIAACSAVAAALLQPDPRSRWTSLACLATATVAVGAGGALLPSPSAWTDEQPLGLNVLALEVPPPMTRRELTPAERDAALSQLHAALDAAEPHSVIVTPETFFGEPPPPEAKGLWGDLLVRVTERQVTALVSMPQIARDADGLQQMNSVQQLSPERRALYAKERLVPGAEYLPWASVLRPVYKRMFERVERGELPGPSALTMPLYVEGAELGVTICHELAFASTVARRSEGADALLNVSDDSWIPTTLFRTQMLAAARARAMETGRPMLRVSRGAPSVLVDHLGSVKTGTLEARGRWSAHRLPTRRGTTPYVRLGGVVSAASVVAALGLAGWAALRGSRSRVPSTRLAT